MSEAILTFQYQLNGVMETVLKTAVHEITRLVKDSFLEEVTGSKQEVDVLKERLQQFEQRWRDGEEERKRREVEEKEQRGMCRRCGCAGDTEEREEALSAAEEGWVIKQEMFQPSGPSALPEREGPQELANPSSSCVSERIEESEAHVVHIKEEPEDSGDLVTQMITSTDSPIMSLSRLQRLSSNAGAWASEPPPLLPAPWASEPLPPALWAREPLPIPPAPWTRKEQHLLSRRKIPDSLGTGVIWRRLNPSLSIIVNQTGKQGGQLIHRRLAVNSGTAMSEAILTFQYQLNGVMETVLKTAMHEITRLVKDSFLEEVTRSKQEVNVLKERLQQCEQRWRDGEEERKRREVEEKEQRKKREEREQRGMCRRCGCAGDTEEREEALSGAEEGCVIKQEIFQPGGPSDLPEREGPQETATPSSSCVSERMEERKAHVVHIKEEPDDGRDLVTQMITSTDSPIMSRSHLQRLSSHPVGWTSEPLAPAPQPWTMEPPPPAPLAREPPALPPAPWYRKEQHLLPSSVIRTQGTEYTCFQCSAMSEAILTFQYQLNGVMEMVLKTAVHEITRLVKDSFLEEVTRSKQEVGVFKERLQQCEQRWRDGEEERKRREDEEKEQRKKMEEREQRGMCRRCGGPSAFPKREGPQETAIPSSSCVSERMEERKAHVVHIKEESDDWGDLVTQMIASTDYPIMSLSRLQRLSSHPGGWAREPLAPAPSPWTSEPLPPALWAREPLPPAPLARKPPPLPPAPLAREPPPLPPAPLTRKLRHLLPSLPLFPGGRSLTLGTVNQTGKQGGQIIHRRLAVNSGTVDVVAAMSEAILTFQYQLNGVMETVLKTALHEITRLVNDNFLEGVTQRKQEVDVLKERLQQCEQRWRDREEERKKREVEEKEQRKKMEEREQRGMCRRCGEEEGCVIKQEMFQPGGPSAFPERDGQQETATPSSSCVYERMEERKAHVVHIKEEPDELGDLVTQIITSTDSPIISLSRLQRLSSHPGVWTREPLSPAPAARESPPPAPWTRKEQHLLPRRKIPDSLGTGVIWRLNPSLSIIVNQTGKQVGQLIHRRLAVNSGTGTDKGRGCSVDVVAAMSEAILTFQYQLNGVMETVLKTAVHEITRLVKDSFLEEVTRSKQEVDVLKERLQQCEQRWRDGEEERKRREVEEKEQRKKREEREQRGMCRRCGCAGDTEEREEALSGAEEGFVIKQEMFQPDGPSAREGPQETATPSSSCVSERMVERDAHVVHIKEEPNDWGDLVNQMVTSTDSPIMSLSRLQRLSSNPGAWTSEPQPPPPLPAPWASEPHPPATWAREPLPPAPLVREPPPLPPTPWTRKEQHLLPRRKIPDSLGTGVIWRRLNPSLSINIVNQTRKQGGQLIHRRLAVNSGTGTSKGRGGGVDFPVIS
ncbi:unnamed protein product [Coregonus sp. 'balchen']|nr:unnamed protein product [Coregonus sp. 'balchen']